MSLRGYQEFGVKYLVVQGRTILGDEMGLGKTIQALGAMTHLAAVEGATHFLVVAPASVAQNWLREVGQRTDLRPHLLHGPDRDARLELSVRDGGVAITSYDTLRALPAPGEPVGTGRPGAVRDHRHHAHAGGRRRGPLRQEPRRGTHPRHGSVGWRRADGRC